ncbi:hypothetical protein [Synechococcus sp. RS9916]|uniref:hypothetical protein n=1 Tax=Synechococcus sp. RS9916 TaxID=221359 RepID=UPI0012EA44A4|nr:hypothetical protein [Synechococcus sp. RS9916]
MRLRTQHCRGCYAAGLISVQIVSRSASFLGPALVAAAAAFHLAIGIVEAGTASILLNLSGVGTAESARRSGLNWDQQHGTRD